MEYLVLGLIVALAFMVEGAAGFGSTVVTVTLGAMLFPIEFVLAIFIPINMVLSSYLVARHRQHVALRLLATRILPMMLGGMALGVYLTQQAQQAWFKPAFAIFVCLLAMSQVWAGLKPVATQAEHGALSPAVGAAWLLVGGFIHGVYASGGPLVVHFVSRELPDKGRFRATLSALWLVMNGILLGVYTSEGRLTAHTLTVSAGLLVSLGVGIVGGEWLHHRLDARKFRLFVAVVLLVAGLGLLLASVRGG